MTSLPRATPESQGVSSARLLDLVNALDDDIRDMHSLMLVRHGHVIAEGWWAPYRADERHQLFSLSKSFTSTAIGMLVDEGRLRVTDKVTSFFPGQLPAGVSPHLAALTVHDLLAMATGHAEEPLLFNAPDWVRAFFDKPLAHAPGGHFLYNTPATYMCAAVLHAVTGQTLLDYLTPRLFEPLGIEGPTWETSPAGLSVGGWGLSIRTEDIAKFGLLIAQRGAWQGRQLVSRAWIEQATRTQVDNSQNTLNANIDWHQGYGYQFWMCRHNCFRGDGAFGQYCVVFPEHDAVLAITSGVPDMQAVLNIVWDKLLPALGPAPLPAAPAAHEALQVRGTTLRIATLRGAVGAAAGVRASGATFRAPGITLTPSFDAAHDQLTLELDGETRVFKLGHGQWLDSDTRAASGMRLGGKPTRVAGSGAWRDEHTYAFRVFFCETPFSWHGTLTFDGDAVDVALDAHVAFMDTRIGAWRCTRG